MKHELALPHLHSNPQGIEFLLMGLDPVTQDIVGHVGYVPALDAYQAPEDPVRIRIYDRLNLAALVGLSSLRRVDVPDVGVFVDQVVS
jgi:hypothetical protein